MSDFKFALSKRAVPSGPVAFALRNSGDVPHDFKIASKKSKLLNRGAKGVLSVTFRRAGRYPYLCTLPGHADAGMKGVLIVR